MKKASTRTAEEKMSWVIEQRKRLFRHEKSERALLQLLMYNLSQCGWLYMSNTHHPFLVAIFFCKMKSAINGSIGFSVEHSFKQSHRHSLEIWEPKCWGFFRGVIKDTLQMNYVRNFSPQINWQMSKWIRTHSAWNGAIGSGKIVERVNGILMTI